MITRKKISVITLVFSLFLILLMPNISLAETNSLKAQTFNVYVKPEYDDPQTLVIYKGDFINSGNENFYGVHPQKQTGLNYVGLSVPLGRLTPEQLIEIPKCADVYGNGSLRVSASKNLILANIPDENIQSLLAESTIKRFTPNPNSFAGYTVSCTGKEFCNLALVETKDFSLKLAQSLDGKIQLDTPIRIHVTGCPNSCGQLQIADIGLRGTIGKQNGKTVEKFELYIGGSLGVNAGFATALKGAVPANKVEEVLEDFINFYKSNKLLQESFHDFAARLGVGAFQQLLDSHGKLLELTGK